MSQFTWFFTQMVRKRAREGGVDIHGLMRQPDGAAVWMTPHVGEPAPQADGGEMDQMDQHFGVDAHRRFTETYRHFEEIHHRLMKGPHWYLSLLGVPPTGRDRGSAPHS